MRWQGRPQAWQGLPRRPVRAGVETSSIISLYNSSFAGIDRHDASGWCLSSKCCQRTCCDDGARVLPNSVRLAVVGRALSAFVTAVRGRQTSPTPYGSYAVSCLTPGCPGGHERRHLGTQRSGWSRRVIPRSEACSVPYSTLVYDMLYMCNAIV